MLQFVLFTFRPLRLEELRQALAIPDSPDVSFSCSDESFEEDLIIGIDKRVISCACNFLEIKGVMVLLSCDGFYWKCLANKDTGNCVQVMHQTVREFFYSGGPTAESKFRRSSSDAHAQISITCIRYLILCAANTRLAEELPKREPWVSGRFEAYVRYLNERPLVNYALSYLKKHLLHCGQVTGIQRFISQFREQLTNNPTSYLLES
jgi:hypothetical protein